MVNRISFCLSCYNSIIAQPEHPSSPTIGYPAAKDKSNLGEPAFGLVIVLNNTLTHTHFLSWFHLAMLVLYSKSWVRIIIG